MGLEPMGLELMGLELVGLELMVVDGAYDEVGLTPVRRKKRPLSLFPELHNRIISGRACISRPCSRVSLIFVRYRSSINGQPWYKRR